MRSSSHAIHVAVIDGVPGHRLNPARVFADALRYGDGVTRSFYASPLRALLAQLEGMLNEYNRDDSRIEEDYFSVHFYAQVSERMPAALMHEREALLDSAAFQDLKVAHLSGDSIGSLLLPYEAHPEMAL